ncbi:(2Fe-2S)-binding protein [Streptomyces sp. enrichment culture]|uniref:(2Fe-2S)-binding protein n=1 Tax=Streptomyces sp. enrichment culture TaxID=1795815 RepID=UPI003F55C9A9
MSLLVDLDPRLSALRPLGGFFALRACGPPPRPLVPLAQVYGPAVPGTGPDPLAFRVRKVEEALRAPATRIAVSVAHQGLAARLWSAALGCAVLYGRVPDLDPRLLHWDPDATAPDDLWLTEVRPHSGDTGGVRDTSDEDTAAVLAGAVLRAHLIPLAAALRARYRVAAGLLRGNTASALAGAARELDRWARAHGRPGAAARARSLTAELLGHPLLAGTGVLTGTAFRRRSCCLYYRVPGKGVCGDCCFPSPPGSASPSP